MSARPAARGATRRGAKALLLVSVVGAASLMAPSATHATASAQFTLRQPSPCNAGSCRVVLEYDMGDAKTPARPVVDQAAALCEPRQPNVSCAPGGGVRTPGGGDKVPHKGWPRVTGILWKVLDSTGRRKAGGPDNDELLGHHGSDRLSGGAGHDILWGDWDPKDNNGRQRDTLDGGAGNDWLYPSHGRGVVRGGPGRDYVWAYYGRGVIDCGAGDEDTARVRLETRFRVRNCERIRHFCAFGSDGKGGCKKPGEARVARRGRR
jgi:hemolysin type calcium-binding protein